MNIEEKVAQEVVSGVKSVLGEKLKKVILYGSYARGDYDKESDIDIMVLADIERKSVLDYRPQIRKISNRVGLENDIFVSLMLKSENYFRVNIPVSNFYRNIINEGKVLYNG